MAYLPSVYFYFSIILLKVGNSAAGELVYIPNFTNLASCDGFSNDFVDLDDLNISTDPPTDEASGVGLSGTLKMLQELQEGYDIDLSVYKENERTKEIMFTATVDGCKALDNEDAPWYSLCQMMGVKSCPVDAKGYTIDDFKLSLEPYKDVLCRDFVGDYIVEMSITKEMDKVSCHTLGIEIVEMNLD